MKTSALKTIALFNSHGGVGTTSLVYHLSWMYADQGLKVLAVDLDPQASLSASFIDEDRLEQLWSDHTRRDTIFGALQPLLDGASDVAVPHVERIGDGLDLLVGDLMLAAAEDELNRQWAGCMDHSIRALQVQSAFWRIMAKAATATESTIVLVDVGPNLGAINRAALIASTFVAVPLAPDLYSLQGLKNLGPPLHRWRSEWAERKGCNELPELSLPDGRMEPIGYVLGQDAVQLSRPTEAHDRWRSLIPGVYRESVMRETGASAIIEPKSDLYCLATLKPFRSMLPMVREARKPMFHLKPADGAIGGHAQAVQGSYKDFQVLAQAIAHRCGIALP